MHYRNGRPAQNGDKIVQLQSGSGEVTHFGVLREAVPGNDYCNGKLVPVESDNLGKVDGWATACMCDCLHVEDLAVILTEKGLDKRPAGK